MLLKEKAKQLLDCFERDYYADNYKEKMFEVNVKRHNDYVDTEELIEKIAPKKYQKELKEVFNDDYVYQCWDEWINISCNWLIEELDKCQGTGQGTSKKMIDMINAIEKKGFSGRSGGHFVFQTNTLTEDDEGLLTAIIDDDSYWIESYTSYAGESKTESVKRIENDVRIVNDIKKYVKNYNDNINFEEEIKSRIEEWIEKEEDKIDNKKYLKENIDSSINSIKNTLSKYSTKQNYNNNIKRNLGSIEKIIS